MKVCCELGFQYLDCIDDRSRQKHETEERKHEETDVALDLWNENAEYERKHTGNANVRDWVKYKMRSKRRIRREGRTRMTSKRLSPMSDGGMKK